MRKIPKVCWDSTLPPVVAKTPDEEELDRWDLWFTSVGLEEYWGKIKQACADTGQGTADVLKWARLVELTRIGSKE